MSFKVRDPVNRQSKSAGLFMFTCQCWKEVTLSVVWLVCEQWECFSGRKHILLPTPWWFQDVCQGFSYPTGIQGRVVEKASSMKKNPNKQTYRFWFLQANMIANLVYCFYFIAKNWSIRRARIKKNKKYNFRCLKNDICFKHFVLGISVCFLALTQLIIILSNFQHTEISFAFYKKKKKEWQILKYAKITE